MQSDFQFKTICRAISAIKIYVHSVQKGMQCTMQRSSSQWSYKLLIGLAIKKRTIRSLCKITSLTIDDSCQHVYIYSRSFIGIEVLNSYKYWIWNMSRATKVTSYNTSAGIYLLAEKFAWNSGQNAMI